MQLGAARDGQARKPLPCPFLPFKCAYEHQLACPSQEKLNIFVQWECSKIAFFVVIPSLKEAQEFFDKKQDVVVPCEQPQSPHPPITGGPNTEGPSTGSPSTGSPSTGSPSTGSPSTGSLSTGCLSTRSPINLEQRKILTPKGTVVFCY